MRDFFSKIIPKRSFAVRPEQIVFWLKGEERQNFGDFLTEVFLKDIFINPPRSKVDANIFRLIGSVINEPIIWMDLEEPLKSRIPGTKETQIIAAYWGCGARNSTPLSSGVLEYCKFFGVRGPLTRDLLGLPQDTVIGDPAILLPLVYKPEVKSAKKQTISISHFQDKISPRELQAMTKTDKVIDIGVSPNLGDIFKLIDEIANASFVLTGALHAAIVAYAYDVPFAYLNTGFIDNPFKWEDFSTSISIPTLFVKTVEQGQKVYEDNCKQIRKLPLLPILNVCPFKVKWHLLDRAFAHDRNLI